MGFFKKTILLSNQSKYSGGMAILNIEKTNAGVFGSLKTFDINKDNLILGVSLNGNQVVKHEVSLSNNHIFNFRLNNDFDCNGNIGCVLVERQKESIIPIIWGSNGMFAEYRDDIIKDIGKDYIKTSSVHASSEDFTADTINNLTINEDAGSGVGDVEELFDSSDEEVEDIINKELDGGFYSVIADQIDAMFNNHPLDEELMQIVPDSKWIKVNYEDVEKEYILGLIYEKGQLKYICYGVPGEQSVLPPKELLPYSQWLATSNGGYWVMFQDSMTGDNIVVDDVNLM